MEKSAAGMHSSQSDSGLFNKDLIEPGAMAVLKSIAGLLANQKVQAYLVGGFVRDSLLGRDTADIDIAVNADMLQVAPWIAQ